MAEQSRKSETIIQGVGAAPGIAIGPVYVYKRDTYVVEPEGIDSDGVAEEIERFEKALDRSERDLTKIISVADKKLGADSAAIFEAQVLMLRDVYEDVANKIERDNCKAEYAVEQVIGKHRQRMEASDVEYLRERATDLNDVRDRIVRHLRRGKMISAIDKDVIVIAQELTAADIVLFSRRGMLGCATDFGGATSHVAIMARAASVPTVMGTHDISTIAESGSLAIIDGLSGTVILNPRPKTVEKYRLRRERYANLLQEQKQLVHLGGETIDGHVVRLRANLEFMEELNLLKEHGAEGVGLFRTEILFLMQGRLSVSEDEQLAVYSRINEAVGGDILTVRVFDLGGDKLLPFAHREHNPFLGWRGIRILLDKPEILEPQLRAILRATVFGPLRILLPMVTTVSDVKRFMVVLEEQKEKLRSAGIQFHDNIPVGGMIEVPSAAIMAEEMASELDFLSIGTNDLTQYILAVDRGNDLVADRYQEIHPAVLRLISQTVVAGHRRGIKVGICGELASRSRYVPILVGLGLDELSMSPAYLPEVKRVLRAIEYVDVEKLAARALRAADTDEVERVIDEWLHEHPLDLRHFLEAGESDRPNAA